MLVNFATAAVAKAMRRASVKGYRPPRTLSAVEGVSVREMRVDTRGGAIRVLFYAPEKAGPLPAFISIHGGGFILCGADGDDYYCRAICAHVGCVVVNVDYSLAPEAPFPAALHECYDVASWLFRSAPELGVDPKRIAIGGHSAGGNLSAAVCLMAKDSREFSFVLQILDYPPMDLAEEGELYADMLAAAEVEVMRKRFNKVPHGFNLKDGPEARESWALMEGELSKAFA